MSYHNPQNLSLETVGQLHRLLTVEEIAILTDPDSALLPNGIRLLAELAPEFYHQGSCSWIGVDLSRGVNRPLSEVLTYRSKIKSPAADKAPTVSDDTNVKLAAEDFIGSFQYLAQVHHARMKEKGFWSGEDSALKAVGNSAENSMAREAIIFAFDGQKLALLHSEISEALEGLRHGNAADDKIPKFNAAEAEFADVILRLMDHAARRGWRVAEALVVKMTMNTTRAKMHGKVF